MKAVAVLALVLALLSGAWAINDYRNNEEVKRDFAREGIAYLSFRTDSGETVQLDVRKMAAYYERRDAMIGALSIVSLIGSTVLFWRRSKSLKPVDSN
jgi:hypothetical protein